MVTRENDCITCSTPIGEWHVEANVEAIRCMQQSVCACHVFLHWMCTAQLWEGVAVWAKAQW